MPNCLPRDSNPDKCRNGDFLPAAAARPDTAGSQRWKASRGRSPGAPRGPPPPADGRAARLPPGSAAPRLMTQPAAPRSPLARPPASPSRTRPRAEGGSGAAARPAPTWAAPPAAPGRYRGRLPPWRPLPGAPRGGGRAVAAAVTRRADAVLPGGGAAGPAPSAPGARPPLRGVEAAAAREGRAWPRSVRARLAARSVTSRAQRGTSQANGSAAGIPARVTEHRPRGQRFSATSFFLSRLRGAVLPLASAGPLPLGSGYPGCRCLCECRHGTSGRFKCSGWGKALRHSRHALMSQVSAPCWGGFLPQVSKDQRVRRQVLKDKRPKQKHTKTTQNGQRPQRKRPGSATPHRLGSTAFAPRFPSH